MRILTSPQLSAAMLEFFPLNERVTSMQLQVAEGNSLTVVCASAPNSTSELLDFLSGVLEGASSGDSIVLLGEFNSPVGDNGETWRWVIGRNSLPDQSLSGALLLDFCANHELSIIDTMFEHKVVRKCTWYQATLGQRLMINFVVVSPDLHLGPLGKERSRAVN